MRNPSSGQSADHGYTRQQSGEISSIVVSTICHGVLLVAMRLLFLAADDPIDRIVTDG